ncbi:hypothetical protein KR009_007621, partial [Drosophila setifemur]
PALPQSQEPPSPRDIILEFVAALDNGSVRSELADDCILNFFGRHVRGVSAVMGYVRSQLLGRFQHERFDEAQVVSEANELLLRERFARSFDQVRRRLLEQKEAERSTTMHLRAESDDEELPSRYPVQLVTPPRPSSHPMDQLLFVEACGVLESLRDGNFFGGLDLGDSLQVHLTLGYRHIPLPISRGVEVCLAVYERYPLTMSRSTLVPPPTIEQLRAQRGRGSNARRNPQTDDEETEEVIPPRRGVRRTLFAAGAGEDAEPPENLGVEQQQEQQPAEQALTGPESTITSSTSTSMASLAAAAGAAASAESNIPIIISSSSSGGSHSARKRHQTSSGTEMEAKRTPGRNRMRF